MKKKCSRCKKDKDVTEFRKNSHHTDGFQSLCKKCQSEYSKEHYHANKDVYLIKAKVHRDATTDRSMKFIFEFLKGKSCADCSESDPVVLEFDHDDRETKSHNVSEMLKHSIATIKKEIAKCTIRCANCHRKRTAQQMGYWKAIMARAPLIESETAELKCSLRTASDSNGRNLAVC